MCLTFAASPSHERRVDASAPKLAREAAAPPCASIASTRDRGTAADERRVDASAAVPPSRARRDDASAGATFGGRAAAAPRPRRGSSAFVGLLDGFRRLRLFDDDVDAPQGKKKAPASAAARAALANAKENAGGRKKKNAAARRVADPGCNGY